MRSFLQIRLLALCLLVGFTSVACHAPINQPLNDTATISSDAADCRTIEHEMGETEVCGAPQRIVVLGPYILEPLLALNVQPVGYADQIAFHQGEYTYPRQQIPNLGEIVAQPLTNVGLARAPSLEAILKTKPDLILGTETVSSSHYKTLSDIAPTLMFDYENPKESLQKIAQVVDRAERAEQVVTRTEQQIKAAQGAFEPLSTTHPKVALLNASSLQDMRIAMGSNTLCNSLIEELGFELVFPPSLDDGSIPSAPLAVEALPQLNDADLIILQGHDFSGSKQFESMNDFENQQLSKLEQAWEKSAIAQSLDASKAGRVYFIPAYLCLGLPGPIGTELYLEKLEQTLLSPE